MSAQVVEREDAPAKQPGYATGRLPLNLAANVANFGLSLVIGLWFTPFLIHHLGTAGYGLIPLAMMTTTYMAVITVGLNSAVGRYLLIALERNETDRANAIFNTSFFGSLILTAVLLPPGLWLAMHADTLLRTPPALHMQARWLFVFTLASFLLNEIKTPFDVSSYCRNRFDLRNLVSIAETITRVGSVALIFTFFHAQIWQVGLGIFLASIVSTFGAVRLWRLLTPMLRVQVRSFDRETLHSLTGTGAWMMVNQLSIVFFLNIDLLVVNRVLGPADGGQYAAVMQWSGMLRSLAGTIASVFNPTIQYHYARGETQELIAYARRSVKLLGLMMALPIGLICGLSRPLLTVWLGPKFAPLAPLMSLMTIHLCLNLAYMPIQSVTVATNHVRVPGQVSLGLGAMNLVLAVVLAGPVHWGMYGVAAAGAFTLTIKNLLFTPLYVAKILNVDRFTFLKESLPLSLATAALAGSLWAISSVWPPQDRVSLVLAGLLAGVVYALAAYFLLLSRADRASIHKMVLARRGADK